MTSILSGSVLENYPTESAVILSFSEIQPKTYKLYVHYSGKGFASIIPEILFSHGSISVDLGEDDFVNTALEGTNELVFRGHGFSSS